MGGMIDSCTITPRFSVLVNESLQGFFNSQKDIRQGDPLPPFLFIIMVEAFGRLITRKRMDGLWKEIKVVQGMDPISHLQFVDDTLLMGEATFREERVMKEIIDKYNRVQAMYQLEEIKNNFL